MHILVIPSERLVPEDNKLEGIFPYHQAVALREAGNRVGALSVALTYSVPMIVKGIFFKLLGRKAGNATDAHSIGSLAKLGVKRVFRPEAFITREEREGVKVYRVEGLYRRPPVANKNHHSWVKAGLTAFRQYVRENGRPDVVHAHEAIYAGMLAERIQQKWKVPYVLTEHSTFYATGTVESGIFQRVKRVYKQAAKLVAVSPLFAVFLNLLFALSSFDYLPNVLDPALEEEAVYESDRKKRSSKTTYRFLNIGLLKPVKDHKTLINALKIVAEKNPGVELTIGGFGNLQHELEEQVKQHGLQKNVRFLGELNREEVVRELKKADCFVLSSKYETFGVVLIEAMLFGKPVVSTEVGIAPEILNEKTGYSVAVGDEQALADAMLKAIESSENFDPEFIRNFALANFGNKAFVNRLTKIYREVV